MQNKKTIVTKILAWMITGLVSMYPVCGLAAAKITDYQQKVVIAADGIGETTATVTLAEVSEGTVKIPLPAGSIKDFSVVDLPPQCKAVPVLKGDAPPHVLLSALPGAPSGVSLTMKFSLTAGKKNPEGRQYEVSSQLVNVSDMVIEKYRSVLSLPPGDAFHSLVSLEPKVKSGGPEAVYKKVENRHENTVTAKNVKIGDRVGVKLLAEPEQKSLLWIGLGILLSVLYLYYFRDLVADIRKLKQQKAAQGK